MSMNFPIACFPLFYISELFEVSNQCAPHSSHKNR